MFMEPTKHGMIAAGAMQRTASAATLWFDVLRAAVELGLARVKHGQADLQVALGVGQDGVRAGAEPRRRLLIDRIAYAVPRVGRRVPWRGDCLVQAYAAQHWLARFGIPAKIHIGGRQHDGKFDAHAWLVADDVIVTGWDSASFDDYIDFNI